MDENNNPIVVGIGELLWDVFPDEKKIGGAPINFAFNAAALGAKGHAVSAVGDDDLGAEIFSIIEQTPIHSYIEKTAYPTGAVHVDLQDGIPAYTILENVAWDFIPFNEKIRDLASKTDAVCFGTLAQRSEISKNTIHRFIDNTPEHSLKILDINLRAPYFSHQLIEVSIKKCNVLKLNDEEIVITKEVFGKENQSDEEFARWLVDFFNLRYLILTAGAEYSIIFSPEKSSYEKTPKVNVVDTIGAGDSFTAAFVVNILKGETLETAHKKAVARAADVCQIAGAWML